ncbi:MAG: dephospho-CoA kinase [Deltaproteobacteria bacterium]|nr:dephospho-CoA kinase [Deltaproteobacteria bacterium]
MNSHAKKNHNTPVWGLTGGIASGKSTVSEFFAEHGVITIDADKIAHAIYDTDLSLVKKLFEIFGSNIGDEKKLKINRKHFSEIIFSSTSKRKQLEKLVHPHIRQSIEIEIEKAQKKHPPLILVEAALMVETGYYKKFDGLIVVKSSLEKQRQRLQLRDELDLAAIEKRLQSQLPLEEKIKVADYVIDNEDSTKETQKQVSHFFSSKF